VERDVFVAAQQRSAAERHESGQVVIETILAAFERQILFELREHRRRPEMRALVGIHLQPYQEVRAGRGLACCPSSAQVGMTQHFLRSYSQSS